MPRDRMLKSRRADARHPTLLRPGYLAALAGCMALVLGAFTWYELSGSRRLMLNTLKEGAVSLVEAVARAGENALRADAEIEMLVVERLLDNARLIAALEQQGEVSEDLLGRIAGENDLFEIDIIDADGRFRSSSDKNSQVEYELEDLAPILRGESDELVFGFDEDELYAVAIARPDGGAIVVRALHSRMLALRLTSGTGRLIQDIGANKGVVYMVLQDTLGIVAASGDVEKMGSIASDPFLQEGLAGDEAHSRMSTFGTLPVFETVMPFRTDGQTLGLLRVGLSVEKLEAEEARDKLQLVLLAGLLLILGAIAVGVVTVRQNYALLDEAYEQVQTYSSRILEQMADAVVALDPAGRIEVFNQAAERLFGLPASQALGRSYTDVLGTDIAALAEALSRGTEVLSQTSRCQTPSGRELTLAVSTSLIRDAEGEIETAVAVMQDLTEKLVMEAEMRRRDRLVSMGALASGVAHEVRNPLNAIALIVQRLEREFEPPRDKEQYLKFIGVVRDEIDRVNRIVKQFLSLARPPALQPQEIELEDLLQKTIDVIAPRANLKGLGVERRIAPVGRIHADPEQLEQAILNLLSNAVEATEAGHIRMIAQSVNGDVEVVVEDTGSGIPADDMERIFDLYFTTKQDGTGLGLSLVHRIVAEHGGRIDVHSQEGRGSSFTIRLPRAPAIGSVVTGEHG